MIEIPPDVQRKHEQPASTQESATVESIHRAVVACGQLCNQLMDLEVLAIDGGELVVASFGDGIVYRARLQPIRCGAGLRERSGKSGRHECAHDNTSCAGREEHP
jgi:hypothetical protein